MWLYTRAIVTILFEATGAQDSRPIDESLQNKVWFEMTTEEMRFSDDYAEV